MEHEEHQPDPASSEQGRGFQMELPPRLDNNIRNPLSITQERLWFLDRLEPGQAVYNRPWALWLFGKPDLAILKQSLVYIYNRHDILRSTILPDSQPAIKFLPADTLDIPVIDLLSMEKSRREHIALKQLQILNEKPFDLIRGPLFRPAIFLVHPERTLLSLLTHHLVFDGWSEHILLENLARIYSALVNHRTPDLPDVPQYLDWSFQQRESLNSQAMKAHEKFWYDYLKPAPTQILQFEENLIETLSSCRTGTQRTTLDSALSSRVRSLASVEKTTPFTILLSALHVLLHRLTAHEKFYLGIPAAGRLDTSTMQTIGPFINTLPILLDSSSTSTFRELIRNTRLSTLNIYTHQAFPFEEMIPHLKPDRDLGQRPIFDILLNVRNFPGSPKELGNLAIETIHFQESLSQTPLTIYFHVQADQIAVEFSYRKSLFSKQKITLFSEQFLTLLKQFLANPDNGLYQPALQWFFPAGIQIPSESISHPVYPSVIQRFLQHVKARPSAVAIHLGEQNCTYNELHSMANTIAANLPANGCRNGDRVAVLSEQSFEYVATVVALFGSQKVFFPVDPMLPKDRILQLLSLAGVNAVITTPFTAHLIEGKLPPGITPIPLKVLCKSSGDSPADILQPPVSPGQPAYIFFTSGSTGTPKGILGKHEGLDHYLAWEEAVFEIKTHDRIGQLSSPNSDAMLRNFFLPLYCGAALCLNPTSSFTSVFKWLMENKVTLQHTVPSLFRRWMEETSDKVQLPDLRLLMLSGEPLTRDLVNDIRYRFPGIGAVINTYGPTETSITKTWYRIPDLPEPGIQPIGFPQPQTEILILNRDGTLCGIGEPGELVIRTPFSTLGYLHPEHKSPHGFHPDPWNRSGSDPLYRTGDLGRYRLDGNIDFLGRMDFQIKIRGVRIEPAEINAVIEHHPSVAASYVKSFPVEGKDPVLCAYLVFLSGERNIPEIRHYLARHLPAVMVPSCFQIMDTLPLLPNGKIAADQLPPPQKEPEKTGVPFIPQDPVLKQLLQQWKKALRVSEISIEDNFFDLGGYSLKIIELISQTAEITGVTLPIAAFYQFPTIKGLFEQIRKSQSLSGSFSLIPLQSQGTAKPLFLIHWAGGFVDAYRKLASLLSPSIPVYGIQAAGIESGFIQTSINAMAAFYIRQLKVLEPEGPYRLAGASMGGKIAFEMASQMCAAGDAVEFVGLIDSRAQRISPPLSKRVQSHKKNILARDTGAKIRYPWERAVIRFRRALYRLFLLTGLTPPSRNLNLHTLHLEMSRLYRPTFFPGRLTIFRAAQQREDSVQSIFLGWEKHALDLETYKIPGSHTSLLVEPGVEMLAEILKRKLATQPPTGEERHP
ncbi:MAG: amino acid adenylation domain-containing protein [Anaerolineales bacterium]|nr:amino acid adenylation domain-containing protein [Anaerolineales bacterium]